MFHKLVLIGLVMVLGFTLIGCGGSGGDSTPPNKYLTYVGDVTGGHTCLVRGNTSWSDMVITARVMFTPGVGYVSFGRASAGFGNFHQLIIGPSGMFIYKATGSITESLGSVSISPALVANHWYTVRFVISGTRFTGYVDGVKYTDYNDTSGTGATQGSIFLANDDDRATAGRHGSFDDIVVTNGDGSVTYITEDFQSYPATANWTPTGGWVPNDNRGTFAIVSE